MVGDEGETHYLEQEVNIPVGNGIVQNWDDMKHLWDYAFGETKLNIDPRTCKVSYIYCILNEVYIF